MVRINDGPNFFMQYKDIFINRIYHFDTESPAPTILDCGGNIGMSVLYYKLIYPEAQITTFEPDPAVFGYLQDNMTRHGMARRPVGASRGLRARRLADVSLRRKVREQLGVRDGSAGGMAGPNSACLVCGCPAISPEPIDFLKINIEGAEWEALADSGERFGSSTRW